jgi:hypothetical protein
LLVLQEIRGLRFRYMKRKNTILRRTRHEPD